MFGVRCSDVDVKFLASTLRHRTSLLLSAVLLMAVVGVSADEPRSGTAEPWLENELLNEAVGLQRDGRFDAALAAYHELLDQNPIGRTHSEALRRTAQLHRQLAQFAEAGRLFQKFLGQYPDSEHAPEVMRRDRRPGRQLRCSRCEIPKSA